MKNILLAVVIAFSIHAFAHEADDGNESQAAAVIPSDFDLAKVKNPKAENNLDVHAAVEKYLEEHPDCESQRERICEVYVRKSKSEKCGEGFKLAESDGWSLNATTVKARKYEKSPSQGTLPPGHGSHKGYGFGVCHKF